MRFATKVALAKTMLQRAFAAGVPASWVTGDTVYGNDPNLRSWLVTEWHAYVLAVPRPTGSGSTRATDGRARLPTITGWTNSTAT